MEKFIIDRCEGTFAVCEIYDDDKNGDEKISFADIPVADLPAGAKEGDIIARAENGGYEILADETRTKRQSIRTRFDNLTKKKNL